MAAASSSGGGGAGGEYSCAQELEKCTSAVNPLLRNIAYMFPSSEDEVKRMCGSWSKLVDCVRKYVNHCFSQQRKQYFNAAVENSIGEWAGCCLEKLWNGDV